MTSERETSQAVFQKLDLGDIDAAIELGNDICKELGLCCTEKGKVMFQVYKAMQRLKVKEAEAAAAAGAPPKTEKGGE